MLRQTTKPSAIRRVLLSNPFVLEGRNRNVAIDPVVLRHAGQEIKTGLTFPFGLASMAAVLMRAGFEVRLRDPLARPILPERLQADAEWSDAIVLPFSPAHEGHLRRFIRQNPGKLHILCGGVAPHVAHGLFGAGIGDIILLGEPEQTIVELCQNYPDVAKVAGLIYRAPDGKPVHSVPRPPLRDLDELPFPARHLTDPCCYWDISFFGEPTAWILATRGCPYDCLFCAQDGSRRQGVRRRSPSNVADEVEAVIRGWGIRCFVFLDETFNLDAAYTADVCSEIIRRRLKIRWWCSARPDLVEEDVARMMKASGCIEMRFGLESANDEILLYLRKRTTLDAVRRGIEITRRVGINFSLQCIFGSPMETEETIRNTLRFVKSMRPLFVSFNILTPMPGSDLYESVKERLDPSRDLPTFDLLHTDFALGTYSSEQLAAIVRRAYVGYYLSPVFLKRIAAEFVRHPTRLPRIVGTLGRQAWYLRTSLSAPP